MHFLQSMFNLEEKDNEISPKTISAPGRGRCRAAGRVAFGYGANLSVAPYTLYCAISRRRPIRCLSSNLWSKALPALEPAGCGGKPDRGNGHHWYGGGGKGGAGRQHTAFHIRTSHHHGFGAAKA